MLIKKHFEKKLCTVCRKVYVPTRQKNCVRVRPPYYNSRITRVRLTFNKLNCARLTCILSDWALNIYMWFLNFCIRSGSRILGETP